MSSSVSEDPVLWSAPSQSDDPPAPNQQVPKPAVAYAWKREPPRTDLAPGDGNFVANDDEPKWLENDLLNTMKETEGTKETKNLMTSYGRLNHLRQILHKTTVIPQQIMLDFSA